VENTTLDDRGLEGAFLVSDHSTPIFWMWSFKFNTPMKMCVFYATYPFRDPSVLQHPGDLSHEDICAMHAADGGFDQDDVSVPQYDLRSHTSPAVTVVAKATSKIKGFFYVPADIIGPATLLQDNLAELHVPVRSGNTPRTKHPYTTCNRLNAVFATRKRWPIPGLASRHTLRTLQHSTQPKTLAVPL